jgi:hypothetical protein
MGRDPRSTHSALNQGFGSAIADVQPRPTAAANLRAWWGVNPYLNPYCE